MNINIKNFYFQISIIGISLYITILFIWLFFPKLFIPIHLITIFIFWAATLVFYSLIKKNIGSEKTLNFVNIFMAATVAKMFFLIIYIFVYIFTIKENIANFLTFVLINYFIFTFFEVLFLIKNQKKIN